MMKSVFIIGAPRSGTNILRDAISSVEDVVTWDCDEINYIFRFANRSEVYDRFTTNHSSKKSTNYIYNQFRKLSVVSKCTYVLEKTCANSLRVPFILNIFPDAKFIYLKRNGYDVVGSAKVRWQSRFSFKYVLKKLRYVPPSDIIFYGIRYLMSYLNRYITKESNHKFWGPKYPGIYSDLNCKSLIEVCALQWASCAKTAYDDLAIIPNGQVIELSYEDFVGNPELHLANIIQFISPHLKYESIDKQIISNISSKSVGKGRLSLSELEISKIKSIIDECSEHITTAK